MVDSRLKLPPPRLLECFVEVVAKTPENDASVIFSHPEDIDNKERMLKEISMFAYPCKTDSPGVQYFSFVLTDIDHKFRFGFCRYPPHAPTCYCILSYVPWFETFYHILDEIAAFSKSDDKKSIIQMLDELMKMEVPEPGSTLTISLPDSDTPFTYDVPDTTKLPTIPENRNLTDYFASVTPENMVHLFISMLFERRILITSDKLNMLTSVVHGSVSLLYPMQWQHIYIPVLPPHLVNFCCAPMPFLIGVHSSIMEEVRDMPIEDVVIFNVDTNEMESPFPDLETFPSEISHRLRNKLKRTDKAYGDYVATQFLKALVKLIGGYRDALKYKDTPEGGKIIFDDDAFLATRSGSLRRFLEEILNLQSFQQFIAGRIDMLHHDIIFEDVFELELSKEVGADRSKSQKTWVSKMKRSSDALGRKVGHRYFHLKAKANDMELKMKMRSFYKEAKTGVKTGYKEAKAQIKEAKHKLKTKEDEEEIPPSPLNPVKRHTSLPATQLDATNPNRSKLAAQTMQNQGQFRHSVYNTMPANRVHHGNSLKRNTMSTAAAKPRRPPPRPPQPVTSNRTPTTVEERNEIEESTFEDRPSPQRLLAVASTSVCESKSEPSITTLIDFNEPIQEKDGNERISNPELISDVGRCNMAFNLIDDNFYHINDEMPEMETRSLGSTPPPLRPLDAAKTNPHSPTFHIQPSDPDEFVYVGSNNEIIEGSLDDLSSSQERRSFPGKRQQSYKAAVNPSFRSPDGNPLTPTSLFSETFYSVSNETRDLFFNGAINCTTSTNPFLPVEEEGQANPPKSQGEPSPGSHRKPPSPPENTTDDPFEDLIAQTKNSMALKHHTDVI